MANLRIFWDFLVFFFFQNSYFFALFWINMGLMWKPFKNCIDWHLKRKNGTALVLAPSSSICWISVKTLAAYIGVQMDANQKTEYDTLISVKNYIWCENFKSIEEKTILDKKKFSQKKMSVMLSIGRRKSNMFRNLQWALRPFNFFLNGAIRCSFWRAFTWAPYWSKIVRKSRNFEKK